MDGGRSDRSGKRQRISREVNKSSSDTELAQGKNKSRKSKSKEKWPLLEGLTVDELARYRRRRIQGQPKDNLGLNIEAESEDLVSEYREAFRAQSEEFLKENTWLENNKRSEDLQTKDSTEDKRVFDREDIKEHEEGYTELPTEYIKGVSSLTQVNNDKTMETEANSNMIHASSSKRPSLIRRGTTLKRDGELYTDTETYSSYVAYEGQHKPELARRPTSLKMEGDLETTTEKCEKFIQWLNVSRPELMRVPTHLKLEGEFETTTENHEKYVPFVGVRRPELLRQNTNLKLNGEANFVPEYADVFKRHNSRERSQPVKPETHLKTGNSFFQSTEHADNFIDCRTREAQLRNESNKAIEEEEERRKRELKEKQQKDEEMRMLVSKLEDLKGPPLEIPEYKDAYKDFPRERPKIIKPEDEIGRADGTKISPSPTPKFTSKIDQDPEYKSKYLDYQRDYPVYRKPPLNLRSTYATPEHTRFGRQECKRHDHEFTSEVRAQYIPYGHIPRVETLKMPANLRLEGNLNLEPEYRTAYCTKRESQLQNEPRTCHRRDRSLSASKRKENYWINNAEQFGFTNAAQDQDAFQVLNTRVHEDNICGKPPTGSRRSSKSSQTHVQRQTQVDMSEYNRVKDRSTSPTYRLHVCNVDDEPKGFRSRRSPSLQSSGRTRNPSPDYVLQSNAIRPYSPSFGKSTKQQHSNGQSFVVLDNGIFDTNKNEIRRKQTDRNYNIDGTLPVSKGRAKTPANWMPPWYDSTNTI
ncbi:uncharacterized protein LOC122531139 [Frieseomelitta varia]|uniref:uncharacterized protein LOC122531139 n=1 Tax=Frieseomelitta varia TaxID=561572 RepID=UPI001CB6AEB9|nr:uncharacterized protein LOC122531139 [Frieseomelitta varia]XP_043514721.1 uncharacterized protein LOC122531139 [Frieseomelitta varia]XP_043514730.1 uncharacterized protein LOC122531139 [Frieseomelitta varia]XP_043514733.1 uncharacterized protein LOC122531139 [Frieseomelitta varia]